MQLSADTQPYGLVHQHSQQISLSFAIFFNHTKWYLEK